MATVPSVYEITCVRLDAAGTRVIGIGNIERRWMISVETARDWIELGIGRFYAVDRHHRPVDLEWDGTSLRCRTGDFWDDTLSTLPRC